MEKYVFSQTYNSFSNNLIHCFISEFDMLFIIDGRDHTYCCKESGITEECLPLCKLKPTDSLYPTPDLVGCVLQKDNLTKCFDEGKSKFTVLCVRRGNRDNFGIIFHIIP